MKSILVPTDFSDQAVNAFALACEIAHESHGQVYLLHVAELPVVADPMGSSLHAFLSPETIKSMEEQILSKLKEFTSHSIVDVPVHLKLEWGNPFVGIVRFIDEYRVDLIVMGSKGASGAKELFVGSNAEKVIRNASVPVITVKSSVQLESLKSILVGLNLKDDSPSLLIKIKQLADFLGANIHLTRINTPTDFRRDFEVLKELERIAHQYFSPGTDVHVFNDVTEDLGMLHLAEQLDVAMIALGTHGRRGLGHFLNGSIAEDIVNHAKRPIWTSIIGK